MHSFKGCQLYTFLFKSFKSFSKLEFLLIHSVNTLKNRKLPLKESLFSYIKRNNIISLSCHEQVCLSGPLKHTCSWHDKLIVSKKVVLFPEIGRVKKFLSLTRLHSRMCIRIHTFNFKKQQTNKETSKQKKNKNQKEQNKLKKKKEYLWKINQKNKFAPARLKIFLVTRICGN